MTVRRYETIGADIWLRDLLTPGWVLDAVAEAWWCVAVQAVDLLRAHLPREVMHLERATTPDGDGFTFTVRRAGRLLVPRVGSREGQANPWTLADHQVWSTVSAMDLEEYEVLAGHWTPRGVAPCIGEVKAPFDKVTGTLLADPVARLVPMLVGAFGAGFAEDRRPR